MPSPACRPRRANEISDDGDDVVLRLRDAPSIGDNIPACANGSAPPLPPGDYTAILVGHDKVPLLGIPTPS
jgi:hypothetical protein